MKTPSSPFWCLTVWVSTIGLAWVGLLPRDWLRYCPPNEVTSERNLRFTGNSIQQRPDTSCVSILSERVTGETPPPLVFYTWCESSAAHPRYCPRFSLHWPPNLILEEKQQQAKRECWDINTASPGNDKDKLLLHFGSAIFAERESQGAHAPCSSAARLFYQTCFQCDLLCWISSSLGFELQFPSNFHTTKLLVDKCFIVDPHGDLFLYFIFVSPSGPSWV